MLNGLLRLPWSRTVAAFDSWAPTYETDADQMIRARGYTYRDMAEHVVRDLDITAASSILEIGTGPGNLGAQVAALRQVYMDGIDISGSMVKLATTVGIYRSVTRASAERLPFPASSVDGAFSAFVLHSVFDQGRVFAELRRVLRTGGRAVIIDLCPIHHSALRALVSGFFHSIRRERGAPALYRPVEDYVRVALEFGFEVLRVKALGQKRTYMHFLLSIRKLC